ncbi:MAG: VWA domain-containing protein [Bdellovibrionales bacterium]|nr:VWA domain-containing protein [Bdellovibrionales bacterium]
MLSLTLAASKPHITQTLTDDSPKRNLILALDVSGSMGTADFGGSYGTASRLAAVKHVVGEFLKIRTEDRIGIVVFGNKAFLQSPLTSDLNLLETLVSGLSVGVAGDGTAIGDGIGLSLKHISAIPSNSSSIILMTDGVNNAGQINPEKAAKVAQQLGVKIHTIGIGNAEPVVQRLPGGIFSGHFMLGSEFDESLLKRVSEVTGGVYFNASNIEGLKKVYQEIDKLEKDESKKDFGLILKDYSWVFAKLALIIGVIYSILTNTIFLKVP